MKVAHLTTVDVSLRFLLLAQLRAALDAGHEVIGISAPGPWVPDLEAEGVRHVALHSSTRARDPLADLRATRELWRVLRAERPDVLHTHNPKPGVYGRVVGRLADVPIVVNTVHGLYAMPTDPIAKRAVVYGLEAIAARFSDAELIQNPEDLALMQRLRLTRRDAELLGNGVDLSRFDPAHVDRAVRASARSEIGAADDQVVVGAVGRLVAEKGYHELFAVAERLDPARYIVVVVGGDDPDKPDSVSASDRRTAERAGVRFLGHRDDIDALYPAMDVFVLASYREGFPRAAMEAAAMALPIVATNVRGCRQVVDDEVSGILVPVRDVDALAAAVSRLGESAELRTRMGAAGRARAECEFDEARVVQRVLATYERVAGRKRVPTTDATGRGAPR